MAIHQSIIPTNTLFPSHPLGIRHRIWEHSGNIEQFPKWCALWVSEAPPLLPGYVWPPIPLWSKCSSFGVDMWASRLPYQCGRLRLDGGVGRGISRQSRSTPLFLLNNGFQKSNPSLCQKTSSKRALYPIYYQDEVSRQFPPIPRPNLCEW